MMVALHDCTISKSDYIEVNGQERRLNISGAKYKEIVSDKRFGVKIFNHLLQNCAKDLPSRARFDNQSEKYKLQENTLFKPIPVAHDPSSDKSFKILTYDSLTSLHWHILSHVIIDSFRDGIPAFKINDTEATTKWRNFRDQVQCPRYSCLDEKNLYDSLTERKQSHVKRIDGYETQGCKDCYQKDVDLDTFLKCCDFFKQERYDYLKQIRKLIIYQIQDANHISYYRGERTVSNDGALIVPRRRHLHVSDQRQDYIYDYLFFPSTNQGNLPDRVGIFKLTLKRINRQNTYQVKTLFGEFYDPHVLNAMNIIIHRNKKKWANRPVKYKCSFGFWGSHPQFHDPINI
jgi:hypothetical protein